MSFVNDVKAHLKRVGENLGRHNLGIVAAGVAFYGFLALFPALAAVISLFGLWASPTEVQNQILEAARALPDSARELLTAQLHDLTSRGGSSLGLSAVVGIFLAVWSAQQGMAAVVTAVNIAYETVDKRSWLRRTSVTLGLTFGAVVMVVVAAAAVLAAPDLLARLGLPARLGALIGWLRWPAIALGISVGLAVVYRLAPDRERPRFRWVTRGSATATLVWLGGSALFSFYVGKFGSYQKTYGSLAAVAILLLWLYVSAYSILLGAEINADLER
jgi:membrane protein